MGIRSNPIFVPWQGSSIKCFVVQIILVYPVNQEGFHLISKDMDHILNYLKS